MRNAIATLTVVLFWLALIALSACSTPVDRFEGVPLSKVVSCGQPPIRAEVARITTWKPGLLIFTTPEGSEVIVTNGTCAILDKRVFTAAQLQVKPSPKPGKREGGDDAEG